MAWAVAVALYGPFDARLMSMFTVKSKSFPVQGGPVGPLGGFPQYVKGPGTAGPGGEPLSHSKLTLSQSICGCTPSAWAWPATVRLGIWMAPSTPGAGVTVNGDTVTVGPLCCASAAGANRGAKERATTALAAAAPRPRRLKRRGGLSPTRPTR